MKIHLNKEALSKSSALWRVSKIEHRLDLQKFTMALYTILNGQTAINWKQISVV